MSDQKTNRLKIYRLLQAHVEFLLHSPEDELADVLKEGETVESSKDLTIRALDDAKRKIGRKRFEAARENLHEKQIKRRRIANLPSDPSERRNLLDSLFGKPDIPSGLTLAFRGKSGDLSDAEVTSLLEDFSVLGLLDEK